MLGWLLQRWLKREGRLLKRAFITNTIELKSDFYLSCTIRKWLQHNIDPYT